jgi:hypothetical protein
MSVSDVDLELLEAHLDGELSSVQDAALLARLATDPELAAELSALRAQRTLRTGVFESFEPDDAAVDRLIVRVRRQITKDAVRGDRMRILRYVASAAACIMFSFSAGWLGKARVATQSPADQPPQMVAQNQNAGSIDFSSSQRFGSQPLQNGGRAPGGYQVAITDNMGRVLAVQSFDRLEDAQAFRDDVGRWQTQQQQQEQGAPVTENVIYKDRF